MNLNNCSNPHVGRRRLMHHGCSVILSDPKDDLMQMSSGHVHRQHSVSLGAQLLMNIISMQELVALKTELHNSKTEKSAAGDEDLQHAHHMVATQVCLTPAMLAS